MIIKKFKSYFKNGSGVAAMESVFIFPVLMMLIFGVVDIGAAILINTKVITATQTASDLLTRNNILDNTDIAEATMAAQAALVPFYEAADFGIDIAGIRFIGEEAVPTEIWRETSNMDPNLDAFNRTECLGMEGDGLIIVTVEYSYAPRFSAFITGDRVLRETSFARGRDSAFVAFE